jgi:hypothetical protein
LNWILIVASICTLSVILWISCVQLWLKHLKVEHLVHRFEDVHRHLLAIEETLDSRGKFERDSRGGFNGMSENMEEVWRKMEHIFGYTPVKYIFFVLKTQKAHLHIAIRYGEELQKLLSLPKLPVERDSKYRYQVYECGVAFLKHVQAGLKISDQVE